MPFYQSIFYGGGSGGGYYGPSSTDVPRELKFYRTNVDNVYTFHWGFDEDFITPLLATADFDLQLDSDPSFSSPNLVTYTGGTAITFQNGNVRKGFTVAVNPRQDGTTQTWYARVRTKIGFSVSDWSLTLTWVILEKNEVEEAENIINNLPDFHVYGKDDLRKAVSQRTSNLYVVANMYGKELDQTILEDTLTKTNNYISLCRDEQLFDNFGTLFSFLKPQTEQFVEYRECLLHLILASLIGGTFDSVAQVIRCFTGVTPDIQLIRDRNDFFATTILETPPEVPNGVITHFSTSVDYIPFSIVVYKNGTKLTVGTDYNENHANPGVDFIVPPSGGSIIQFFFDIGDPLDPNPVILDITDTTNLSGTVTFTNGSATVTGVGTSFLTQLQPGRLITDSSGIAFGIVDIISTNTSLVLTQGWVGSTGSGTGKVVNFNGTFHITGTVNFVNSSPAITGSGTLFLTELIPGDAITDNGGIVSGIVNTIITNTSLTLQSPWTGTTNSSQNARKLVYSEPLLWDRGTLAYGFIIRVLNPGQFDLDRPLLEGLVNKLIPSHTRVFYEYV